MYDPHLLNKYLTKRSFHDLAVPHNHPKKLHYSKFIVIPCYNEYDFIFQTLDSINEQNLNLLKETIVIIVINNSNTDSNIVKKNNQLTYDSLIEKSYFFEFIILNNFDKKNALKDKIAGVGTARKIGFDYCLNFVNNGNNLFCSLDADTIMSPQYLSTINNEFKKKINVAVVNFQHQKSNDILIENGIRKYESIIKKIASKIHKTGSPYGYVSMGSTIICNVKSYIACGGMPKKKATEDFYFMQALAKYTKIKQIKNILVYPSSRDNQRVYLGTGYRMKKYKQGENFTDLDYNRKSYKSLKIIIDCADRFWGKDYCQFYQSLNNRLDKKVIDFLSSKSIESVWNKMKINAKNKKQFMLFFHQWFDALMIIQLLKKLNN